MDTFRTESCVRGYFNAIFTHVGLHVCVYTNCSLLKHFCAFNFSPFEQRAKISQSAAFFLEAPRLFGSKYNEVCLINSMS